jgi:hypothetical protein
MEYDRDQLNRAFWDLGLRFQWDDPTWRNLVAHPKTYDCEFLGRIVEERLATPVDARVGLEAHRSF